MYVESTWILLCTLFFSIALTSHILITAYFQKIIVQPVVVLYLAIFINYPFLQFSGIRRLLLTDMAPIKSSSKVALVKLSSPTFCRNITAMIVILAVLTLAVHGAEGSQPQFRRNVDNKQITAPSCFNSFSKCWNISECRNAYRGLKKRCKVSRFYWSYIITHKQYVVQKTI